MPGNQSKLRGKRKFLIALLCWVGATTAVLLGRMSGGEYVMALSWLLGLYGASNVGEHFANRGGQ